MSVSAVYNPTTNRFEREDLATIDGVDAAIGEALAPQEIVLYEGEDVTESENGEWVDVSRFSTLVLTLDVTAFADNSEGDPETVDVAVYTASDSAGTDAAQVAAFTQVTGVVAERKIFTGLDNFCQVRVTVAGDAPEASLTVAGVAK